MRTSQIVNFAVAADQRLKLKASELKDMYLVFANELKKLWKMKVTVVPIVIGALSKFTKGF